MGSIGKSIGGSIHRIREFELEKVNLAEEFDLLQIVGEGWFGKILLVEHKATDTEMVLKALPKPYTALRDFYREFHYGLHLGAHKNIITTYDVSFETAGFYVFSQEYAPLGDLTSNVTDTGIGELHTKRVAKQLSAALEHLHTRDLVHRDVKLDNILVFKSDFSRIKLCDFGETRRAGTVVPRRNEWLPYAPPEVLEISNDNSYKAETCHDVWQFGIVIFVCLTGCLPWQKAALEDPRYSKYYNWHTSSIPLKRQPKLFKLISSKAQKLFKKYLEPRAEKRPAGLAEVHRYMEDRWMSKTGIEKTCDVSAEEEGLCPSMYSFHSSPEEKNKLLHSLTQYGLETTVDRVAKKDRIRQWIQSSVIDEEDEDYDEEDEPSDEDLHIKDIKAGPIGERINRGPVTTENGHPKKSAMKKYGSTLSLRKEPEIYKPPIDPRIPLELQRSKSSNQLITQPNLSQQILNTNLNSSGNIHTQKGSTVRINESVTVIGQNSISLQNIKINGDSPPFNMASNGNFPYPNATVNGAKNDQQQSTSSLHSTAKTNSYSGNINNYSANPNNYSSNNYSKFSTNSNSNSNSYSVNANGVIHTTTTSTISASSLSNNVNVNNNNNTVKHSINIQVPQSDLYDYESYAAQNSGSGNKTGNGIVSQRMYKTVNVSSPTGRKKSISSDGKRYDAYGNPKPSSKSSSKRPTHR